MIYEMYVQIRDVYKANKDGVSVFIRTDRRGIFPTAEGQGGQVPAAVGQSGQQGNVSGRFFSSSYEEGISTPQKFIEILYYYTKIDSLFPSVYVTPP